MNRQFEVTLDGWIRKEKMKRIQVVKSSEHRMNVVEVEFQIGYERFEQVLEGFY